jgi:hypothetical protein
MQKWIRFETCKFLMFSCVLYKPYDFSVELQ